jgi:hypothetical protein
VTSSDDPTVDHPRGAPAAGEAASGRGGQGGAAGADAAKNVPKARPVPDPPEMDQSKGRKSLVFVLVLLVVAAVTAGAVLALNAVADPYGTLGTHILPTLTTSDRTVKADAIEALDRAPELVVLGSSRAMRYEPAYLGKKTGLSTFNAGVNGIGGPVDMWAMAQFIHEVWPDARPAYLWMLDVEGFVPVAVGARTANEPRLAKYVGVASAGKDPLELARAIVENRTTLFSLATAKDSLRLVLYRDEAAARESTFRKTIRGDGALRERRWTEKEWKKRYPESVDRYSDLHRNVYKGLDPEAKQYFERTLQFMNDQGVAPIIALTPLNPKLRKVVGPLGWTQRREEVLTYLKALQSSHSFVLVDITDPAVFGADPGQWYDGVHMTTVNTRRAIDHILEKTEGIPP